MTPITLVVPCYNEATRLVPDDVAALLDDPAVSVLLVDDGSTDDTATVIAGIAEALGERVQTRALDRNRGKAEAVRRGLLAALEGGAEVVGYLDADFATPPSEALRMVAAQRDGGHEVVIGARIRRLGAQISRPAARHYLGRAFATVASLGLGIPVYDTQCGAKLFQVTPRLEAALQEPFASRWAFDVELLERLLDRGLDPADALEVPLGAWRDVEGSKLTRRAALAAARDLLGLTWRRRVRR